MRKFSINREKKDLEPNDQQIKKQKDFSRLHHDYELLTKRGKRPIYRNPKLYMLLFLIGIIVYLMFFVK